MAEVVGVDIGGTKTHLAIAAADDANGANGANDTQDAALIREAVVPTSSWRDTPANAAALRDVIVAQLGPSAATNPIAVGAHGCDSTAQCRALQDALQALVDGPVTVVNDAELMPPAMGVVAAIGIAVGTGSIAVARGSGSSAGELITAGGWGWLLGDEGSSAGIVREATRAVLADLDRGRPVDQLGRRLMAAFKATDGPELFGAVTDAASAEQWGQHAAEVFAAADEGSTIAAHVIREAGEQLAGLVGRLRLRGIRADAVVAGGAVIERQRRLRDAFTTAMAREFPTMSIHVLDRPPVMGAIALARRSSSLITEVTS